MDYESRDVWVGTFVLAAAAACLLAVVAINKERLLTRTYPLEITCQHRRHRQGGGVVIRATRRGGRAGQDLL